MNDREAYQQNHVPTHGWVVKIINMLQLQYADYEQNSVHSYFFSTMLLLTSLSNNIYIQVHDAVTPLAISWNDLMNQLNMMYDAYGSEPIFIVMTFLCIDTILWTLALSTIAKFIMKRTELTLSIDFQLFAVHKVILFLVCRSLAPRSSRFRGAADCWLIMYTSFTMQQNFIVLLSCLYPLYAA